MEPILTWDREIYRSIHIGLHHPAWDNVFLLLTYSGDGWQAAFLAIACFHRPWRRVCLAALASWALAGLVRLPLAAAIGRMRPSNFLWSHPLEKILNSNSFPSGHTTTSFAIAICIALCTRGTKGWWIGALAIVWAAAVGFSRVYIGVHYPFDALGGVGMGAASAATVYLIFREKGWFKEADAKDPA